MSWMIGERKRTKIRRINPWKKFDQPVFAPWFTLTELRAMTVRMVPFITAHSG